MQRSTFQGIDGLFILSRLLKNHLSLCQMLCPVSMTRVAKKVWRQLPRFLLSKCFEFLPK